MSASAAQRLSKVEIDQATVSAATPEIEHDRQVAAWDLVEQNSFAPTGAGDGPFVLRLAFEDNRLVLEVTGPDYGRRHMLSLNPLAKVMKDYLMICDSYSEAVRNATPSHIEAIDMGRRGLHNEGSDILRERLAGKIELDHETARRLFTLICAISRR